jgi:hypothetical protein
MIEKVHLIVHSILALAMTTTTSPTSIIPLGDSITLGIDYTTNSVGGYRSPLYGLLSSASIPTQYLGVVCYAQENTTLLNNANQNCFDGFGGYHTVDLDANLAGVANPIGGGNSNLGGYWITGGPNSTGCPNLFIDISGTNDIVQDSQTLYADKLKLDQDLHALCPASILIVGAIPPLQGFSAQPPYDAWIQNTLVPELVDANTGKQYAVFVDEQSPFLSNGAIIAGTIGNDNIHPTQTGYNLMAPPLEAAVSAAIALLGSSSTSSNVPYVFVAGGGDVGSLNANGTVASTATAGGGKGAAVDANGYVWSINSNGTSVSTFTPAGALSTSYSPAGLTGASALAIDGNSNVLIANSNGILSVVSNSGAAVATMAGSTMGAPSGVAIDSSGNVWVANPAANSIDEIIGGAVPAAPLANAVQTMTPGGKP